MRVNNVSPTFKGEGDVYIRYNDGKNAKNPFVNNELLKLMEDLRKEHISAAVAFKNDVIEIVSPSQKMIDALADTNLVCRVQRGNKLKLII